MADRFFDRCTFVHRRQWAFERGAREWMALGVKKGVRALAFSFIAVLLWYIVQVMAQIVADGIAGQSPLEMWYAGGMPAYPEEYRPLPPSRAASVTGLFLYGNLVAVCVQWSIDVVWVCLLSVCLPCGERACQAAFFANGGSPVFRRAIIGNI